MHFGCRFGLLNFCKHLLKLPGGRQLLDIPNQSGLLPSDIASNGCHLDLAKLLLSASNPCKGLIPSDGESLSATPDSAKASADSSSVEMACSHSGGLDADIDMLHQLIEEIKTDCHALDMENGDLGVSRRTIAVGEHSPLDSIPENSLPNASATCRVTADADIVLLTDVDMNLDKMDNVFSGVSGEDGRDGSNVEDGRLSEDVDVSLTESVKMTQGNREEVEAMTHDEKDNGRMDLKRFSTSCPSLEISALYDAPASAPMAIQPRQNRGQYKSMLDVTQEENEEEVEADACEAALNRRPSGERPKSLDFSALGPKLSIAGVTVGASSSELDKSSFADKNTKVSFTMFGGAKKEKTRFHQGVESAGKRSWFNSSSDVDSFSLGSLGSEDDEEEQRTRRRGRSPDSDGPVKPIDIPGARLQKLPNVDFTKYIGQQSDGSSSSLYSTSQEQLSKNSSKVGSRHSEAMSALPLAHISTNLNKAKSISTPSIPQADQGHRSSSSLLPISHHKAQSTTNSSRRTDASRRQPPQELYGSVGPSNYEEDERKSKKGGRRTSVFAKFGSVRKPGKGKEKGEREVKRSSHNFISISLSNATCSFCSKLLHHRPSVQCSNCLMNYHDECKDRVMNCTKQKLLRDRKPPSSLLFRSSSAREKSPSFHNILSPGYKSPGYKGPLVQSLTTQASRHDSGEGMISPSIVDSYSPSMESLADDGNADDEYEDDPELTMRGVEHESWSETIDKKLLKSYKGKYVQRQDNIWELIATEKQYCLNLRIMQKVFARGMRDECDMSDAAVKRIFPELDELIDLHQAFLSSLVKQQDRKPDKSIDQIGSIIVEHFGGTPGERMKRAYGIFCSRHKEGVDYFKHLYKTDRKLQSFIKRVSHKSCTKRRGVQDFVTVVTMRMTKYKTLLENIIKNSKESKDKADRETLHKGLDLNKEILDHIDVSIHSRNQELRLMEIYNRMDARSMAVYDKTKKFKKSDLTAKSRKLRHEGVLYWRNAREKEVEMLVVVLSDVILFLQETDKKYSFFTQDNKPSVVPLTNLIVREKGSTKDNRGIYLIRQSRENPEMYELVCKSSQDRRDWIDILRKAVNESPEEDEGVINETEEEHREVIGKLGKLREYVEILDYKDKELEQFCRERFSIIADIMQVYDYGGVLQNIKSSYDDDGELKSASELIKLSLDEASMLASLYQTLPAATNLGRSWSSVGERHSPTYQQLPLPKRAETFNGFDQEIKSPVSSKSVYDNGDSENCSPSIVNLQQDSDGDGEAEPNSKTETSRSVAVNRRSSSNILHQILSSGSMSSRQEETDSGNDSLLTMSSMLAITAIIPPSREQAQCVTQLNEYLHGILLVVNKQDSMLENMKQQLADVTVRSRKAEHEQEIKSALRHNKQMEDIRNRHEQLTKERAILESEKENLKEKLERERLEMESLRADVAHQQNELKKEREELQRQKEALQKQIDFYQVKGYTASENVTTSTSSSPHLSPHGSSTALDTSAAAMKSPDTTDYIHKRSHSAELVEFDNPQMFVDSKYSASLTEPLNMKEMRAQHLGTSPDRPGKTGSAGNLGKPEKSGSQVSLRKASNNNASQQIPSKLSSGGSAGKAAASNRHSKSVLPMNLVESSKKAPKNNGSKATSQGKKADVIYF
ncbi:rho guanine nucleotide exchange factor 2-like isoform X3 [Watersipora subatra]|uniref:rho guanine nucleotide exchange factor 2-like isoform X3 n=1 Tax=Watersipora subatra TaxID=2589382 RepID=UPI00355C3F7A